MSDTPTKVVINCTTGEEEIVPLTAEEIAQLEADRLAYEQAQQEYQFAAIAKEEARLSGIAKLVALGLTEEEANALVK